MTGSAVTASIAHTTTTITTAGGARIMSPDRLANVPPGVANAWNIEAATWGRSSPSGWLQSWAVMRGSA